MIPLVIISTLKGAGLDYPRIIPKAGNYNPDWKLGQTEIGRVEIYLSEFSGAFISPNY